MDKFWLGCASTSWGTGAVANGNWTTSNTATCSGGVPTSGTTAPAGASDTATIKSTGTNFPILVATDAITVTSFTINAGAAVNAAAGSLTSSAGNADIAVNGTLLIGAGTVVVGRDLTVSGTLAMTGGSLTVPRDFLGTGVTTMTAGTLRAGRNFGFAATGWSAPGGTVEFTTVSNGNGNQLAGVALPPAAIQFNHLSVSGTGDANLDQNGKTLNVAGNYSNTSTNANDLTSGTFVFNGAGAQTVGGTQTQRFNNLTVAKPSGTATLAQNETVGGNLGVSSGTLDLSTFTLNHTTPAAGNIAISNGAVLKIGGTGTFPINYLTRTIGATSTVEYNGTNQAVPSVGYGHLILSGTGTKTTAAAATTVSGNLTVSGTAAAVAGNTVSVAGNVTLGTGTSFDAGNFSHSFRGNFSNGGTFTKGASTVTFDGLSAQTIGGANPTTFNNLTIAQAVSLAGVDVTADGTLALNNVISTGVNKVIANGAGGGAGGVTRSASGLVNGNLEKPVGTGSSVARTFQVGTGTTYTPVDLTFATVGTAGRLVARSTPSEHLNIASSGIQPAKSVNRYWTLTPNPTLAFTTYDATFTFVAGDVDAGANTAAFVVRRNDGTNWHTTTAGTRTATSTQATGVAALSDFAVGEADLIGPVTANVAAAPSPTNTPPTVTAQVSDTTTGGSNITGGEYFLDVAGAAGTGTAMTASDGTFNSVTEGVTATLSAAQFDGLSDGQHTVYVRGRDAAGNWGATDSANFVKDTTGPTTAITFPADGGVYNTAGWNTGCPTPGLCGTATDDAGVGSVQVSIRRVSDDAYWNGFGFAAGPETYVAASGTTSWSYALAASVLTDGDSYSVHAKATDGLGNLSTVASNGFTYDTTRPSVTVEQAVGQDDPTNELPIHFTAEFSEPVDFDDADVSLGGTSGQAGATIVVTETADNVYDIAVDGITDGTLTASVADGAVEDAAGNGNTESTSGDNEVTYDNTDPESEASSPAFSNASETTIPVDYTASDNLSGLAEVELWAKKDSGPWELADTDSSPGASGQFEYTPSGDGTYRFYTIAVDNAGNREAVQMADAVTVVEDDTTLRDTVAPAPSLTSPPAFTNDDTPAIAGTAGTQAADESHSADDDHVTVTVLQGTTLLQTHSNVPVDSGDGSFSVDATHLDDGDYTARVDQSDAAGNSGFDERDFEVDTVRPDVTIDQAIGQADPTNDQPINFTVRFTEQVSGFDENDVTFSGSSGWASATVVVTGSGADYNVAVSGLTDDGTLTADVDENGASDVAGNGNTASTSTDNTVTFDTTNPEVTVNQKSGQPDPTNVQPIEFTATFTEPVTGFDDTDVTLGGTAGSGFATVTVTGSGDTYNIAVSGLDSDGTLTAEIGVNAAEDAAQNGNNASTSTDNQVLYDATQPEPTLSAPPAFTNDDTPEIAGTAGTQGADSTHSADDNHVTVKVFEGATLLQTHSNVPVDSGDGSFSVDATHLDDGEYTALVEQSDAAGNGGSDVRDFEVDTIRPDVTINQASGSGGSDERPADSLHGGLHGVRDRVRRGRRDARRHGGYRLRDGRGHRVRRHV